MKRKFAFFVLLVALCFANYFEAYAYTFNTTDYYFFESALNSRKVLDVSGGSSRAGANIQLWEKNGSYAQLFKITKSKDGYYAIINKGSNMAIDVYGGNTYSGANVQQWNKNETPAQQWKLYNASGYPDGYINIVNRSGKYLDASGGRSDNGTNIQIYDRNNTKAQVFRIVPYVKTSYVTIQLGSFSTVDEWVKQLRLAEQLAVGINNLSYNLERKIVNTGKMIVSKNTISKKNVAIKYIKNGRQITEWIALPSKIQFKLHEHEFKQNVIFDMSYVTITQSCGCGQRSQMIWEVPWPDSQEAKKYVTNVYPGLYKHPGM